MISIFAFKLSLIYLIPYIYLATRPETHNIDNLGMTTSYLSIRAVNSVSLISLVVSDIKYETKLITNRTNAYILVDLPSTLGLCDMLMVHAPSLECKSRDTISSTTLMKHLDPQLIRKAFNLPGFNYMDKSQILELMASATYNYPFLVQSFPSLAVKLQAPVLLKEGNDCGAEDCTRPRVEDFFIDGVRDTLIYGAVHLGTKHVIKPYVAPALNRIFEPIYGRPYRYLKNNFVDWYNRALYAADSMSARAFEAGAPASLQNVAQSSISVEMSELLPDYSFRGPPSVGTSGGIAGSIPPSLSSDSSLTIFKSPIGSSSAVSTASGAMPKFILSTKDAGTSGIVRAAGLQRYQSAPALPALGRGVQATNTLSQTTLDILTKAPVSSVATGELASINVIKSSSRSVLATLSKALRRVPKRRRRQSSYLSKKVAMSIRAVGRLVDRLPSWVGHAVGVSVPWVFAGTEHLTSFDVTIKTIFPIQKLAPYERYFIAMFTLLAAQCFHDSTIRQNVLSRHPANETISVGAKRFTPADVVFDISLGIPGDTLQECLSIFRGQVLGIEKALLLETLSVHFDTTYVLGDILLYNGPAKYIINDYFAYFNDVFPAFSPYVRHSHTAEDALSKVEQYNNDFLRAKRHAIRTKRDSYTFHSNPSRNEKVVFRSSSPFTTNVKQLLEVPKLRYEFDILQAAHYNTSFSYYNSLRRYASTQSINFGDTSSSSEFRMLGGITIIEIIRGLNPFDIYLPRLNMVRELIGGYNIEFDIRRLREVSTSVSTRIEYADLPTLLGLFYLLKFPTDMNGFKAIQEKTVSKPIMMRITNHLYRHRYARVPILFITQTEDQLDKLRRMFIVHTRRQDDVSTWVHYSPIMLTTALSMISSGAYSICVSKTRLHTAETTLFGEASSDLGAESLFFDACDLATIHVTYDTFIEELVENLHIPDRVKSLLSVSVGSPYTPPSGGVYDPVLSEIIDKVEPTHGRELLSGIRGSEDDSSVLGMSSSPSDPVVTITTAERLRRTSTQNQESPLDLTLFFQRNWILLAISLLLVILLCTSVYKLAQTCREQRPHIEIITPSVHLELIPITELENNHPSNTP